VDILVGDAGNDNLDGQGSTGDRLQGGSGTNILNLQSGTDIQDETTVFNFPF
jgi:Ca2+-binding RTX toxin-like protein